MNGFLASQGERPCRTFQLPFKAGGGMGLQDGEMECFRAKALMTTRSIAVRQKEEERVEAGRAVSLTGRLRWSLRTEWRNRSSNSKGGP